MKVKRYGGKADLAGWHLNSLEAVAEGIEKYIREGARRVAEEAIDFAFTDEDSGGLSGVTMRPVDGPTPLTINVSFSEVDSAGGGPWFEFDFAELALEELNPKLTDPPERAAAIKALRDLADKLERWQR